MVDYSIYKSSFKFNFLWICLLIFGTVYFLKEMDMSLFDDILVKPILSRFPKDNFANILLITFLVFSIHRLVSGIIKLELLPSLKSLTFFFTLGLIYIVFVRSSPNYIFYGFDAWGLNKIKYSDIIVLSLIFLFIDLRSYKYALHRESSLGLIEDNPDPIKVIDKYGSQGFASTIVSHIKNTTTYSSFAIGVFCRLGIRKNLLLIKTAISINFEL